MDIEFSLISLFAEMTDPKLDRKRLHQLGDILTISILAVVCIADNWTDIETSILGFTSSPSGRLLASFVLCRLIRGILPRITQQQEGQYIIANMGYILCP